MKSKFNLSEKDIIGFFLLAVMMTLSIFGLSSPVIAQDYDFLSLFGSPLPQDMFVTQEQSNPALIDLGRKLYYEKRLSKSQRISCNSCHQLDKYGVDHQAFSTGHGGQLGGRNAPTVYNAAAHIAQFWDGRAADVEEQALGPILNPVEMAMASEEQVLLVLNSMPEYVAAFQQAFPEQSEPVSYENVGVAIGAFERKLVTPAPFDAYLAGDTTALTKQQQKGLNLFVNLGCVGCHTGTYVGGQFYQKAGLVEPWPNQKDQGRYEVTGKETDRMVFKVPALRNIAKTAPYFHDGSAKTLKEAVKLMARKQLGKELSNGQVQDLVAFLESLTGEIPTEYIQKPQLPKSTAQTPVADLTL